jgi:Methyltransferase domain
MRPDRRFDYLQVLSFLQQRLVPRTYLEIGVETGRSLALVPPGTRAFGIDPQPTVSRTLSSDTVVIEATSDAFFETSPSAPPVDTYDLAFIDGMHLFESVLRDFINVEKRCHENSVIVLHDLIPASAEVATREHGAGRWTGDVWKVLLCLAEARPELDVTLVDVAPSGLGLISGLDPTNTSLAEDYDELVERHAAATFEDLPRALAPYRRVPPTADAIGAVLPARFRRGSLAFECERAGRLLSYRLRVGVPRSWIGRQLRAPYKRLRQLL